MDVAAEYSMFADMLVNTTGDLYRLTSTVSSVLIIPLY